jgi:hypothetical protein
MIELSLSTVMFSLTLQWLTKGVDWSTCGLI